MTEKVEVGIPATKSVSETVHEQSKICGALFLITAVISTVFAGTAAHGVSPAALYVAVAVVTGLIAVLSAALSAAALCTAILLKELKDE